MTVTRNSDGSYDVAAQITVGGSLETINLTQVTLGYRTTYYTDLGTPFQLSLDQKRAVLSWGYVRDPGIPVDTTACWGEVLLTAADGVNDAPFAVAKEEIIPAQCIINYIDGSQTDGVTLMFAAKDGDGYINGPGIFKVTGDTATTTVLTHTSDPALSYPASQTGNTEFTADGDFDYSVRDPFGRLMMSASPTYGGVTTGDTFTISKDCSKAVSWEYTVTDNEGASHTIWGLVPARDVAPVSNPNSAYINGMAAQVYNALTLGDVSDLYVDMYYGNYDLGLSVFPLPTSGTVSLPTTRWVSGAITATLNDTWEPSAFDAYLVGGSVTVSQNNGNTIISIYAILDIIQLDGVVYHEGALSYPFSATIVNPTPATIVP